MAKLFTSDDFAPTRLDAFEARQFSGVDVDSLKDSVSSMVSLCERMESQHQAYDVVAQLKVSTEQLNFKTEADYQTVDNNVKIFNILQRNLGIDQRTMPSMEDFNGILTRKSSKEIAMEGFTDFIKRIWKMIKEFVVAFYNRVILFFKRLLGMRLNNTEVKDYIKKNLDHIRVNDLRVPIDNQIAIPTRLPLILAKPNADKFTVKELETTGMAKIGSHLTHLKKLGDYYNHQVKDANDSFAHLKGLLEGYVKNKASTLNLTGENLATLIKAQEEVTDDNFVATPGKPDMNSATYQPLDPELIDIIDKLAEYAVKQKSLLEHSLNLTTVTDMSKIPEVYKTKMDASSPNVDEVIDQHYYAMHDTDAMLSNFNIYMREYSGNTTLKPSDEPGATVTPANPVTIKSSGIKLASGPDECKNVPSELNVVYRYGTLVELYEKAKQLESFSVKDSAAFVEKIGALVIKYVKELQEIFEKSKVQEMAESIIKLVQEAERRGIDVPPVTLPNAKAALNNCKVLSEKFSKGLHSNMIDISRDMCAQISTINQDAATEIFNYVYKCTKEYK